MKLFKKVAVVGVGLIGGSMALDIKKKRLAGKIVGMTRSRKTVALARRHKVVDACSQDLEIIRGADLVVLATPVNTIMDLAPKISRIVNRNCLVTDVGSTKQEIVLRLEKIFPHYIGSHPLAGSEKRGVAHARAGIFRNSLCILTPTNKSKKEALGKMRQLWHLLDARVVVTSPSFHDRALSFVSHLPHIVAFCLIDAIPREYLTFGATGLKDTTRIASSEPELWRDIFMSNRKATLDAIASFQNNLAKIKELLRKKDIKRLDAFLSRAKNKRDTLK